MCIEFVDMSMLMSMRLDVMCLGQTNGPAVRFDVGRGGDEMGGGRWDQFQRGDVRGETISLSKDMNERRVRQRTHVLRDLPSIV